jgi:hypothetical protein
VGGAEIGDWCTTLSACFRFTPVYLLDQFVIIVLPAASVLCRLKFLVDRPGYHEIRRQEIKILYKTSFYAKTRESLELYKTSFYAKTRESLELFAFCAKSSFCPKKGFCTKLIIHNSGPCRKTLSQLLQIRTSGCNDHFRVSRGMSFLWLGGPCYDPGDIVLCNGRCPGYKQSLDLSPETAEYKGEKNFRNVLLFARLTEMNEKGVVCSLSSKRARQ